MDEPCAVTVESCFGSWVSPEDLDVLNTRARPDLGFARIMDATGTRHFCRVLKLDGTPWPNQWVRITPWWEEGPT